MRDFAVGAALAIAYAAGVATSGYVLRVGYRAGAWAADKIVERIEIGDIP